MYSKIIATLFFLLIAYTSMAHSAMVSTTVLTEDNNGNWTLEVKAALTALEYEVRQHYGAGSFKDPEEFKKQFIQHSLDNISISLAHGKEAQILGGIVELAHVSTIRFQVADIPKGIDAIQVTNTMFKQIEGNQNTFTIVKRDSTRLNYILNGNNEYTQEIDLSKPEISLKRNLIYYIVGVILVLIILFVLKNKFGR